MGIMIEQNTRTGKLSVWLVAFEAIRQKAALGPGASEGKVRRSRRCLAQSLTF